MALFANFKSGSPFVGTLTTLNEDGKPETKRKESGISRHDFVFQNQCSERKSNDCTSLWDKAISKEFMCRARQWRDVADFEQSGKN